MEPLVTTINSNEKIEGLGIGRIRNNKCPSYADNLTLTLLRNESVIVAFEIIESFLNASGLKLNKRKTQGLAIRPTIDHKNLPQLIGTTKIVKFVYDNWLYSCYKNVEKCWKIKKRKKDCLNSFPDMAS